MTTPSPTLTTTSLSSLSDERLLRTAVAAYLSRFKALSRSHAESDLRAFLGWCAERRLDPLAASRPQVELYVRWMQEVRRLKPSTTSRRMSVVAGFYRTAVIDGLLEHSPAEHVRRPRVPAESPTLGLTHLQLEALLSAARQSPNRFDFALVCLLGLLACGSSKPPAWTSPTSATNMATASYASSAKAAKPSSSHSHRRSAAPSTKPPPTAATVRSCSTPAAPAWTGTPPAAASARSPQLPGMRMPPIHPHMLRHTYVTTMLDAGVDLRDVQIAARHADPRTTMRYDRARNHLDRHPNYILAAYMASGT